MAQTPTHPQLQAILAELREALDSLEGGATIELYDDAGRRIGKRKTPGVDRLMALLSAARRDGYRTSSLGGGTPSGTDADGEPLPPHGDPVGEVASNPVKILDPIRQHGEVVLRCLTHAVGDLRRARAAQIAAFEDVKPGTGDPACMAHASAGMFELATNGRAGRCDWCYRFWLVHRVTPPIEILRARANGRRITPALLAEALRPSTRKGRKVLA